MVLSPGRDQGREGCLLIGSMEVEVGMASGRTQITQDAVKVRGKVYGSSGVGVNRKKG